MMTIRAYLDFFVITFYSIMQALCLEDPCLTTNHITEWERTTANKGFNNLCDHYITPGWYRVTSPAGELMPTECPAAGYNRCGAHWGYWLSSKNVSSSENLFPNQNQTVQRVACRATYQCGVCCDREKIIQIKNCSSFLVYWLEPTEICSVVYCFGNKFPEEQPCFGSFNAENETNKQTFQGKTNSIQK